MTLAGRQQRRFESVEGLQVVKTKPTPLPGPVQEAIVSIEKRFGEGAVMRMVAGAQRPVVVIPTGVPSLDVALGCGGWPRGRIVEMYGAESTGKSSLALHAVAQAQRLGDACICAYVDAEHALDIDYARALGVRVEDLLVSQPDSGEQALEIVDQMVRTGAVGVVVVDSVAALTPQSEIDGDFGDAQMGAQARLMSQAMRKLTAAVSRTNTLAVMINQTRQRLGVLYGSPITTTGGNALKFYASVRVEVAKIGQLKRGEESVGNRTRAKVVKNKLAPPFRQTEFDLRWGMGADREADLLDAACSDEATGSPMTRSGTWYSCNGERVAQGREGACTWLRENPKAAGLVETWMLMQANISRLTDRSAK